MLIEQIFELRGPGLPGRICIPVTGYFYDKTIISKDRYLMLKYAGGNVLYFPLPEPNHLRNLIPKCKILDVFCT